MSALRANGITVVSASAGSGKTYRLTEDVSEAIDPNGKDRLPLESLVAVTYTKRAHAELAARIRQRLVSAGAFDAALRLPLAYVGTVHAMCLRLLQEFAIDAGLSPNVDVVAEDAGKLLRQALEASLPLEAHENLDRLAYRFKLRWQDQTKRHEWLGPVSDIMDLARSNRMRAEDLPRMAERSLEGLLRLLPTPEQDGDALDDALARELAIATKKLTNANDPVKKTKAVLELLERATRRLSDGELDWSDWARLADLTPSAGSKALVVGLEAVASRYVAHPRLHAELRELTFAIFEAARIGLFAYQTWKERRRVVDYVDMLDRALDLVSAPRVERELAGRLELVVVDEFQDTSPIQLALFMKLHALSERSVWVGDRKQCIFEYAGADPLLMDSVASWVEGSGGQRDVLSHNYRSRPELVDGFTRARDHLVLAVRTRAVKAKTKKDVETTAADCEWLDGLVDGEGEPLLTLPVAAGDGARDVVRIRTGARSVEVPARVWRLAGVAADAVAKGTEERRWFARPAVMANEVIAPVGYRILPSSAAVDWPELVMPSIGEIVTLTGAMPLDAKVAEYNVLGDAVHAFFAADVEGLTAAERGDRAGRLLASAGLVGVVSVEALVAASDRLRGFVDARWPGAVWHREVAIDALVETAQGERRVVGVIDLLVETAKGYVIFDHKTFPGRTEAAWRMKVVEFLPQFAAYAAALRKLGARDVLAGWVHLPAGGGMVEVAT